MVIDDFGPFEGVLPRPRDRTAGRKRLPPDVRRKMLLEAARDVIAARGLHATTVRDVAAAGRVAVGTVTYHFSSMQEVLAGVLENEMETYSADIWAGAASAPTGLAGLTTLIDGLVASDVRAHEHWKLWLDFWALAAHYPQYSTWQSRVYRDLHQLTSDILSRGAADGTLQVRDTDGEAVEFIALLDGLVVQSYLPESRLTPSRARAVLHHYVRATMVAR
jgi:AcrR family transcriptional regulator